MWAESETVALRLFDRHLLPQLPDADPKRQRTRKTGPLQLAQRVLLLTFHLPPCKVAGFEVNRALFFPKTIQISFLTLGWM
jgi:hypothetical protein